MIIYILLFICGLVFGSFYMVVGLRRPLKQSIVKPPSHCEVCEHYLKWYELIPVLSFIISKGKCRHCHNRISFYYPLVELLSGFLFALAYYIFGFSYECLVMICLASLLIIIFVSDFKYFVILDGPLIIFSLLIILFIYLNSDLKVVGFKIMAGLILALFMVIVRLIGNKIFKRDSLGGGDIKLSFLIGLVLGVRLGFVALIISSFIAFPYALYVMNKKEDEMPYGPFLITALIVCFIFQSEFLNLLDLLIL